MWLLIYFMQMKGNTTTVAFSVYISIGCYQNVVEMYSVLVFEISSLLTCMTRAYTESYLSMSIITIVDDDGSNGHTILPDEDENTLIDSA